MKRLIFILFCVSISQVFFAQNAKKELAFKNKIVYDTLIVYDTIFVTDTVHILKKRTPETLLANLPTQTILLENEAKNKENQHFLVINQDFAATFSSTRILLSDNNTNHFTSKNSDKMKKIGFFGVVFFAFQNMVVAQNAISIGLGGGFYQIATTRSSFDATYGGNLNKTSPSAMYKLGINGEKTFAQGKVSIIASLNYTFQQKTIYSPSPNFIISSYSGYEKNFHSFSIPIGLRMNRPWIKPFVGVEGYYRKTPVEYSIYTDPVTGKSSREGSIDAYFGAGLLMGCDIPLSNRLTARLNYCKGLTVEYDAQMTDDKLTSRLNKTEITVLYTLAKRKKVN